MMTSKFIQDGNTTSLYCHMKNSFVDKIVEDREMEQKKMILIWKLTKDDFDHYNVDRNMRKDIIRILMKTPITDLEFKYYKIAYKTMYIND